MKRITGIARSPYFVTLIIVAVFGFLFKGASWGFAAKMVRNFPAHWWQYLLALWGLALVVRHLALRLPSRPVTVALVWLVSYGLVFRSQLLFTSGQPTYLSVLIYLMGTLLLSGVWMDPLGRIFTSLARLTRFEWVRIRSVKILLLCLRMLMGLMGAVVLFKLTLGLFPILGGVLALAFLLVLYALRRAGYNSASDGLAHAALAMAGTAVLMAVLHSGTADDLVRYYLRFWIVVILIMPFLITLAKRCYTGVQENYFTGVLVFFFSNLLYRWAAPEYVDQRSAVLAAGAILVPSVLFYRFSECRRTAAAVNRDLKARFLNWLLPPLKKAIAVAQKIGERAFPVMKAGGIKAWNLASFHRMKIALVASAVALVVLIAILYPLANRKLFVVVTEFSPSGLVGEKTVIRLTFSDPVAPAGGDINAVSCFTIQPDLSGEYRMEGDRTVVFIPSQPLAPSTEYKVRLDSRNLTSAKKKVSSGATIRFHTELFALAEARMFYLYDLATGEEKQIVGELNFNQPVVLEQLQQYVSVDYNSQSVGIELEPSFAPTRFYFKTGVVQRGQKAQSVKMTVRKGLSCVGGSVPLTEDAVRTISLPARVRFKVTEFKLWHEPGNTMISVLFNKPVTKEQARRYITVSPKLPLEIDAEYCYVVLRGDFKPNQGYKVTVRQGMPCRNGEGLEDSASQYMTIRDVPSSVKFAHNGRIVPLSGDMNIAVKTVNLDYVRVSVKKVFRNNLVKYLENEYNLAALGTDVYDGSYKVKGGRINEELEQCISLRNFHGAPYKGLFVIQLSPAQGGGGQGDYEEGAEGYDGESDREGYYNGESRDYGYYNRVQRWFICTDIGLVAKHTGEDLWVYALSLKNLSPLPGVIVRLISTTNQTMEQLSTGSDGRVVFRGWRKNPNNFVPLVVIAEKDEDFSFLKFSGSQINPHNFAVGGVPYSNKGLEAFVTTERGVYRPGEKAYINAIIRNRDFTTPPPMHCRLVVNDPQGTELARLEQKWDKNGMVQFQVPFTGQALTGEYRLRLERSDRGETIGSASLKVEEFIPDKLKVEITADSTPTRPGRPLVFTVRARQLFGAPAAGHRLSADIRFLARTFSHASYKEYTFCDPSRSFEEESQSLGDGVLDQVGAKQYQIEVPPLRPPSALTAYIYAEIFDTGSRLVSAASSIPVDVYPYYLGLKALEDGSFTAGKPVTLNYVAINPQGKSQKVKNIQLLVKRRVWYSIFRRADWGRSGYQSSSYEEVVLQKVVDVEGRGSVTFTPEVAGQYFVYLGNEDAMRTGLVLEVTGEGYQNWGLESPEKLEITMDKETYSPGGEAVATIKAPFPGTLYLSVEREKVYTTQVVEIAGRTAQLRLAVSPEYLPNVYVVGMLLRKPGSGDDKMPMVSFGVAPLLVDKAIRRVDLEGTCPSQTDSKSGIDVTLKVGTPGAGVVLMAVDQGILQITNFNTPDPLEFFYRKNALTTQLYSVMDMVLPVAVGGDEGTFSRRHLNPIAAKKPKSMAVCSPILIPDAEGQVSYHFNTANFNGEVRVMAVAAGGWSFGSFSKAVTVTDPIVLVPAFPRFTSPGDQFEVPVQVYNNTGKAGTFEVALDVTGPASCNGKKSQSVSLDNKAEQRLVFTMQGGSDAGVAVCVVTARGAGVEASSRNELAVRPAAHLETTVKAGVLDPGKSFGLAVPSGFIPYGQRIRLTVSTNPMIRYLQSLEYLIGYPYGCAEQITSKTFPLLYLKELGMASGMFADRANAVDLYIQNGIEQLGRLQLSDGGFSLWPGGGPGGQWLSLYVCHFLVEAQRQEYAVKPELINGAKAYLGRLNAAPQDSGRLNRSGQNLPRQVNIYALYVKTLAGYPDRGLMGWMVRERLKSMDEFDRSLLSLCYSETGDKTAALSVLKPEFKSLFQYREQYGSFNSPVRNTALYLMALSVADPSSPRIQQVIDYLGSQLGEQGFGNTQENAWTIMSLGRTLTAIDFAPSTQVTAEGQPYATITDKTASVGDRTLSGKKLEIKNAAANQVYYHFIAEGSPLAKRASDRSDGMEITRTYCDEHGKPLNLSSVSQGQLAVATVTVKVKSGMVRNLVVVDLLPGGFEIENPRLSSRGSLGFEPAYGLYPACMDIRDDRLLLFVDQCSGTQSFSYAVRAVTAGRFTVPNVYAEAMYEPNIRAEHYEKDYLVVVPVR